MNPRKRKGFFGSAGNGESAHEAELRDPELPTEADALADATEESENVETCTTPETELESQLAAVLHDLRLERASFATYRQRVDKEKAEIRKYGGMDLARELLRVVDYLEMSLQFETSTFPAEAQGVLQGVQYTVSELNRVLEQHGIVPLKLEPGTPFDPNTMQAVSTEVREDLPAGSLIAVQTRGYLYKDRVLRTARVAVSVAAEELTSETPAEGIDIAG